LAQAKVCFWCSFPVTGVVRIAPRNIHCVLVVKDIPNPPPVAVAISMKLQVQVRTQPETKQGGVAHHTVELVVSPQDTVWSIKDRILTIEPTPFPDQDLVLDGEVLGDDVRLADCTVQDGSTLDLVIKASDEVLTQQLSELLQARAMSPEELGLLYTHRHGVTVGGALKAIGRNEQLRDYLKQNCCFTVENDIVSSSGKSTVRKPAQGTGVLGKIPEESPSHGDGAEAQQEACFPVHVSVLLQTPSANEASSLDLNVRNTETVLGLKERIGAAELIPFPDRKLFLSGGELHDKQTLVDCKVKDGSSLDFVATASEEVFAQQLSELLQAQTLSINELSLRYSYRHGATVARALKSLGLRQRLADFVGRHPDFAVEGGCVRLAAKAARESRRYLDLHSRICGPEFSEKASAALERAAAAVARASCLRVRSAVRGGSVGRGTAAPGAADAEVVLFVEGLPLAGRERWLPGLVGTVTATLEAQLSRSDGIHSVTAAADSVQVCCEDDFTVNLLFAPVIGSSHEVIEMLGAHPYTAVALAEQRVHFIAKQPESVKMTMRLLKWWRGRQRWSEGRARPSDALLELAAVHAASQCESSELSEIMERVLALLADFDSVCIAWAPGVASYSPTEVPQALLRQRPLLLDPVNPLVNVADPQVFVAQEMMTLAKSADL